MSFFQELEHALKEEGFVAVGWVSLQKTERLLKEVAAFYQKWLEQKYHGSMAYLLRHKILKSHPTLFWKEAQTVVCALWPYSPFEIQGKDFSYASYLRGEDYHVFLRKKWENAFQKCAASQNSLKWRICVDSAPVFERFWAACCGLGWIGKNGLLIHPRWGSYVFLSEAFVNQASQREPSFLPSWCGRCQRCLEACPTQALLGDGRMDARKCLSYMTLESKEPWDFSRLPPSQTAAWLAGCDICQKVCPFNRKRFQKEKKVSPPSWPFSFEEVWELSSRAYKKKTQDTALSRVRFWQFQRNACALYVARLFQEEKSLPLFFRKMIVERAEQAQTEREKKTWQAFLEAIQKPRLE